MKKKIVMFMLCLPVLALSPVACDSGTDSSGDADADSDTDSDTDADGDFPGNCECAARFTLNGQTVNICEDQKSNCRCATTDAGKYLSCRFFSTANSDFIKFTNLDATLIEESSEYSSDDGWMNSLSMNIDKFAYLGTRFTMNFVEYSGKDGIASGTFTATLRDNAGTANWKITDGQFYAPIVAE